MTTSENSDEIGKFAMLCVDVSNSDTTLVRLVFAPFTHHTHYTGLAETATNFVRCSITGSQVAWLVLAAAN
jgi:hypothetical protein